MNEKISKGDFKVGATSAVAQRCIVRQQHWSRNAFTTLPIQPHSAVAAIHALIVRNAAVSRDAYELSADIPSRAATELH